MSADSNPSGGGVDEVPEDDRALFAQLAEDLEGDYETLGEIFAHLAQSEDDVNEETIS